MFGCYGNGANLGFFAQTPNKIGPPKSSYKISRPFSLKHLSDFTDDFNTFLKKKKKKKKKRKKGKDRKKKIKMKIGEKIEKF